MRENIENVSPRDPRFRSEPPEARDLRHASAANFALGAFFLILVLYILGLIVTNMSSWGIFNADIAPEIAFGKACLEQKTLFPAEFVGAAESLLRGLVFPFMVFYAATGNGVLSYQCAAMVGLCMLLASFYFLLHKLKLKQTSKLFSLCMLLAFLPNAITETLPCGIYNTLIYPIPVYCLFGVGILLTLALRISAVEQFETGERKRRFWIPIALLLLLAVRFGFGTIKMAMILYVPLLCVDGLRLLLYYIQKKPMKNVDVFMFEITVVSLIVYAAAYTIFLYFHGNTIDPEVYQITNPFAWLNWGALSNQIGCILTMFGFSGWGKLSSVSGMRFLLSCCMVLVEILALHWMLKKENSAEESKACVTRYCVATTAVLFLIYFFGGLGNNTRSYFAGGLVLPIVCGSAIDEWSNREKKQVVWPALMLALCLTAFFVTTVKLNHDTFSEEYPDPDIVSAAEYIRDNGYDYVVASFDYAGRVTNYTNGAVENIHCLPVNITQLIPYRRLIDNRKFTDEKLNEAGIFLLSDEEEQAVSNSKGFVYWMIRKHSEKVKEIGPYNLYTFSENPFTLLEKVKQECTGGLPEEDQQEKTDLPYYSGYAYEHAAINADGEAVSDGSGDGFTVFGPYSPSVSGTYNITVNYVVDTCVEGHWGTFDVALDTQPIVVTPILTDKNSVTLERVSIDAGHQFEARVYATSGMIIRVQSIHYERVSQY